VTRGPVFDKVLTKGPGPTEKRINMPESTAEFRIHGHLCFTLHCYRIRVELGNENLTNHSGTTVSVSLRCLSAHFLKHIRFNKS